jgi:hypothetical protein
VKFFSEGTIKKAHEKFRANRLRAPGSGGLLGARRIAESEGRKKEEATRRLSFLFQEKKEGDLLHFHLVADLD